MDIEKLHFNPNFHAAFVWSINHLKVMADLLISSPELTNFSKVNVFADRHSSGDTA